MWPDCQAHREPDPGPFRWRAGQGPSVPPHEPRNNVLVLDEPTNHLDVDAKEELKRALKEYKGSILMVCHEPDFYEGWMDQIWDFNQLT